MSNQFPPFKAPAPRDSESEFVVDSVTWDFTIAQNADKARTAPEFLVACKAIQDQRAKDFGQPGGERSMDATTAMFNAATGQKLSAADGWLFMVCLKIVRDQATKGHQDSVLDGTNYMSLYAEARMAAMPPSKKSATGVKNYGYSPIHPRRRDMELVLIKYKDKTDAKRANDLFRQYGEVDELVDVPDELVDVVLWHAKRALEGEDTITRISQAVIDRATMRQLHEDAYKIVGKNETDAVVQLATAHRDGGSNISGVLDSEIAEVSKSLRELVAGRLGIPVSDRDGV